MTRIKFWTLRWKWSLNKYCKRPLNIHWSLSLAGCVAGSDIRHGNRHLTCPNVSHWESIEAYSADNDCCVKQKQAFLFFPPPCMLNLCWAAFWTLNRSGRGPARGGNPLLFSHPSPASQRRSAISVAEILESQHLEQIEKPPVSNCPGRPAEVLFNRLKILCFISTHKVTVTTPDYWLPYQH